ncbi:helix-turn-helix transcriptional regulator [Streptomyces sp. NPDC048332]|uniref:helix-turn-helix domain-containing protein n=1 Tax=Streptomyces sp. NPDC048332 TaxID=3154619 RepID=UPI0034161AD8
MTGRDASPEWAGLCRTLRELRAGTGLSLAALAARTPYSKSSWERYLNGGTLPPRQAVEQLCALAGVDPRRPVAQWELAETVWSGRAGAGRQRPAGEEEAAAPADRPGPRAVRPRPWVLGAAILVVAATAATLVILLRPGPSPDPLPTVDVRASVAGPGCHGATCTGKDAEDLECSNFAEPPTTLGEQRLDGTVVKVRHSAVCETVWARIDRGAEGDLVEVLVPDVRIQRVAVKDRFDATGSVSTPMAAASAAALPQVRACLVRAGERHCFTVPPS